jgi:hypothetical protein
VVLIQDYEWTGNFQMSMKTVIDKEEDSCNQVLPANGTCTFNRRRTPAIRSFLQLGLAHSIGGGLLQSGLSCNLDLHIHKGKVSCNQVLVHQLTQGGGLQ